MLLKTIFMDLSLLVTSPFEPFLAFFTALLIAWRSMPAIIYVAHAKYLMDEPGERSAHSEKTPTLGGIAIFAGLLIAVCLWSDFSKTAGLQYMLVALVVLFFLGIKDDLVPLSPSKKLVAQTVAALLVIVFADIRIDNLQGLFQLYMLPYWASVSISLLLIIFFVNAYNLIDGIDGLAGGLGLIASAAFGMFFYLAGEKTYAIMCFALAGTLISFLRFNFSVKNKIFMGDTGSMILGFMLTIFAIRFLSLENFYMHAGFHNSPVLTMLILLIPIVDTLRVFGVRILQRKSPFTPDKNHIHHLLLNQGLNHMEVSCVLYAANILLVILGIWVLNTMPINIFFIFLCMALFAAALPYLPWYKTSDETMVTGSSVNLPFSSNIAPSPLPRISPSGFHPVPGKLEATSFEEVEKMGNS